MMKPMSVFPTAKRRPPGSRTGFAVDRSSSPPATRSLNDARGFSVGESLTTLSV
jgi:hypothetical protein